MTDPFTQTTEAPNYLENLVGEGKKFSSVEELARGKAESDVYIDKIKTELEELKAKSDAQATRESILEEIKASIPAAQSTQLITEDEKTTQKSDSPDIAALVAEELAKQNQKQSASTNMQKAVEMLDQKVGVDKRASAMSDKAKELGVSEQWLKDTAAKSPQAFMTFFSGGVQTVSPSVTTGSANTSALESHKPSDVTSLEQQKVELKTTPPAKRDVEWYRKDTELTFNLIQAKKQM